MFGCLICGLDLVVGCLTYSGVDWWFELLILCLGVDLYYCNVPAIIYCCFWLLS